MFSDNSCFVFSYLYYLFLNIITINIPEHILDFIIFIIYPYTFYLMPVIILARNTVHTEPISRCHFFNFRSKFAQRTSHICIYRSPVL